MAGSSLCLLFIDQHGQVEYARNITELRTRLGTSAKKMYVENKGVTYHIGYVLGDRWFRMYEPFVEAQRK